MSDKVAIFEQTSGNRQQARPTTAPRQGALTGKCGTVRGQIKAPFMGKYFSPMATGTYTHPLINRVNYYRIDLYRKDKGKTK
jgi:hypothetical protein